MQAPNVVLIARDTAAVPKDYLVPAAQEIEPLIVRADIDGSGAAGQFDPTLQVLSPAGDVIFTVPASTVAAGGSASVTWAPFLRGAQSTAATGGFSGGEAGPITQVGAGTSASTSKTGTTMNLNVALPAGIQAGDVILAFIGVFDNDDVATITASPAGWKLAYVFNLPVYGGSGWSQSTPRACYYKVATGTEGGTVVTFTIGSASSASLAATVLTAAFRGVNTTTIGSYFFQSYTVAANTQPWSLNAPAVSVAAPSSQVLQVFYDVKRSTSVTKPADVTVLVNQNNGENAVTLYLAGKTADSAPADTWTGTLSAGATSPSYLELVQIVLNPLVTAG